MAGKAAKSGMRNFKLQRVLYKKKKSTVLKCKLIGPWCQLEKSLYFAYESLIFTPHFLSWFIAF